MILMAMRFMHDWTSATRLQEYDSKPKSEGFWEAHHAYLAVQYVASGAEHMGYRPVEGMEANPYDEEKDFYTLEGEGNFTRFARAISLS